MWILHQASTDTQLFKLYRMPTCSLHSFHTITNFYIIYSVSTLEFATVVLASVTTLLITTTHCNYKDLYHVFQVIFSPLLVSADCTFEINNKKFTEDRFTHLLFESYQKNELWKWGNTSCMGPSTFFPTLWNPYQCSRPYSTYHQKNQGEEEKA